MRIRLKANIEKTVENRNLQDLVLEVWFVPLETVVEIKNGTQKAADKKMFPGYVLINMVMNDSWYVVRNTREVLQDLLVPVLSQFHLLLPEIKALGITLSGNKDKNEQKEKANYSF